MRDLFRWVCSLALLCAAYPAIGSRIDFESGVRASTPSLAIDPARGLVLTWQTREGNSGSLHYALLDAQGREIRRAEIVRGSDWFINWADFPSLVVLDNNDWMTYWLEKSAAASYAYDVRIIRSTNGGGRWSAPLTPHDDGSKSEHGFVSLLPLDQAQVQVLWLDGRHSLEDAATAGSHHGEGPMSLRAAVIDRRGRVVQGRELDARSCSCCQTDATRVGDRSLFVYRDRSAQEVRDIYLVERDGKGQWSTPQVVNADNWTTEACPVNGPAISANGEAALVVWPTMDEQSLAVRYRVRLGQNFGPTQTLEQGSGVVGRVDVSPAAGGGFAVSWIGAGASGPTLKLADIDADGKRLRTREVAALGPGRDVGFPRLAWYRDAHFLTWTESLGQGKTQIVLHRLAP